MKIRLVNKFHGTETTLKLDANNNALYNTYRHACKRTCPSKDCDCWIEVQHISMVDGNHLWFSIVKLINGVAVAHFDEQRR